ncbi:MAG: hypothetical protein U0Q18_35180 [Bryobacteraceae bacterium]
MTLLAAVGFGFAQPSYTITTVAGQSGVTTFGGDGGAATSAGIGGPVGLTFDSSGNLYIADQYNNRIRKISGGTISTISGNGTDGYSGDGSSATSAELSNPAGMTFDSSGNLYIADAGNYVVRKVAGGNISTFAGVHSAGAGYSGDGAAATSAQLYNPSGVAFDSAGNLYIADPGNNVIRMVATNGNISTFAGNNGAGYSGDGGTATSASLNNPNDVAFDSSGNLYIADSGNHVVRKVSVGGTITTVAGTGASGYSGDGKLAINATLNTPKGIALDSSGNLYIADSFNSVIRVVLGSGIIKTIAGNHAAGAGFSGDGGAATSAQLFFPSRLVVSGNKIYVADTQNDVIRLLTPAAAVPVINSGGAITASNFGGSSSIAPGSWVEIYGTNLAQDTRTWTGADFSGSTAPKSLDGTSVTIGGQQAFISYISQTQVNVQVPNVGAGTQQVVVTTGLGSSTAYSINVNSTEPGLFAPPSFKVGGNQYVGALFLDGHTFAMPTGAVSGITSRPAKPGDTIVLYGVGFGSVTPNTPAGQIASGQTTLSNNFTASFGSAPTTVTYSGLAPGLVGLYQFNVTVPTIPASDTVPLTFSLGSAAGKQTLFIAVQN